MMNFKMSNHMIWSIKFFQAYFAFVILNVRMNCHMSAFVLRARESIAAHLKKDYELTFKNRLGNIWTEVRKPPVSGGEQFEIIEIV